MISSPITSIATSLIVINSLSKGPGLGPEDDDENENESTSPPRDKEMDIFFWILGGVFFLFGVTLLVLRAI